MRPKKSGNFLERDVEDVRVVVFSVSTADVTQGDLDALDTLKAAGWRTLPGLRSVTYDYDFPVLTTVWTFKRLSANSEAPR